MKRFVGAKQSSFVSTSGCDLEKSHVKDFFWDRLPHLCLSLHVDRFRVNDNISITPIFYLITKPEHNDTNDSIWVGLLRTSLAL
jgi:hypothetical protein